MKSDQKDITHLEAIITVQITLAPEAFNGSIIIADICIIKINQLRDLPHQCSLSSSAAFAIPGINTFIVPGSVPV